MAQKFFKITTRQHALIFPQA